MELVFATNNSHKLSELQQILGDKVELLSLSDIGCSEDIPETENTLEGNAALKARYIFDRYGLPCFADDTGLEVEALNGEPGVFSARYAGENKSSDDNVEKLLQNLEGIQNRRARFRTVICLIKHGKELLFEGEVKGIITLERRGSSGFGYDPVFEPEECGKTFAEMSADEKNTISHRGRAVMKLAEFILHKK